MYGRCRDGETKKESTIATLQWKNIIEGLLISSVQGEAFKEDAATIEGFFKEHILLQKS